MTNRYGRTARRDGEAIAGDYFASMTDLMLGLVFIFIIMLMVSALNMRRAEHQMTTTTTTLTEANLARRDLLREIARILGGTLPVTIDAANGTLRLGSDVLFPQGSDRPYPDAVPKLRLLAAALDRVLPCYAGAMRPAYCEIKHSGRLDALYIEGHTDRTPIDTIRFPDNWALSAARASQTFRQLVAASPGLGALKNDDGRALIGISGYGKYRPIDQAGTAAAMQMNRRIELRFIMATPDPATIRRMTARINDERSR